tara:strand:+ start:7054 stop:7416 length:363 start_codon:yes stop_codon:yes gene_type:complete
MSSPVQNQDTPLESTKSHALQAAEELRAAASAKAAQLKQAAESRASQIRDVAGEQADTLKSAAGEQAGHVREVAEVGLRDARAKVEDLKVELEAYVRENPTKAVLTTFGIGVFLGMLLRR